MNALYPDTSPVSSAGDLGGSLIVGVGGTFRAGSTSEQALRYALREAAAAGAATLLLSAADLQLPLYQPDATHRTPAALRLVDALRRADGVIIASPSYHGGVSGLVKNALDYAEDLSPYAEHRGPGARPYLDGRAFGCIATGAGWQAPVATLGQLRSIGHALRAWPTPLGVVMNSSQPCFTPDGAPVAPYDEQLARLAQHVVDFIRTRMAPVPMPG
ncbi:NADPH-dependent FMN reductase [Streptomyces sp. NPDC058464]|uniref:NADPH-dependent FMN reductase n=1 Tax=Streptomyces sp. NPDC058464 TaxID=3346511 RepID=UPI003653733E